MTCPVSSPYSYSNDNLTLTMHLFYDVLCFIMHLCCAVFHHAPMLAATVVAFIVANVTTVVDR